MACTYNSIELNFSCPKLKVFVCSLDLGKKEGWHRSGKAKMVGAFQMISNHSKWPWHSQSVFKLTHLTLTIRPLLLLANVEVAVLLNSYISSRKHLLSSYACWSTYSLQYIWLCTVRFGTSSLSCLHHDQGRFYGPWTFMSTVPRIINRKGLESFGYRS